MGNSFLEERLDKMYYEAPFDKKGKFNYTEFTHILNKSGTKDKEDSSVPSQLPPQHSHTHWYQLCVMATTLPIRG